MEIPSQYKATLGLNILGTCRGKAIDRVSVPPPSYGSASFGGAKQPARSISFQQTEHTSMERKTTAKTSFHGISTSDNNLCPICITNTKDMAFGCGHQRCCECGIDLQLCPICRSNIQTRIKLY
ncbi:E3 ubiquitin-protein ligase RGLG2-like [Bidens hawaiensis]|uniref:E3 ubiquitin-protein ligase RGLG2-like n=1 Tax=Bidens hawaiensis TaxID=980011 RepID=UPI00404A71A6